jgi:hypothetical protein
LLSFLVVSFLVVSVDDFVVVEDFLVVVDVAGDFSGAVVVVVVVAVSVLLSHPTATALRVAAIITRTVFIGVALKNWG